jgi:hypothetical protein
MARPKPMSHSERIILEEKTRKLLGEKEEKVNPDYIPPREAASIKAYNEYAAARGLKPITEADADQLSPEEEKSLLEHYEGIENISDITGTEEDPNKIRQCIQFRLNLGKEWREPPAETLAKIKKMFPNFDVDKYIEELEKQEVGNR